MVRSRTLTERQGQVLDFIIKESASKGYPPSVREIGAQLGLSSSSTVHNHLAALESKGYIRRDPSKPRAIEVIIRKSRGQKAGGLRQLPLLGQTAAGSPLLAVEEREDTIELPSEFVGSQEAFALKVRGDSMTGVGIMPGDVIIVRRQTTAVNGDIVVALLEDETTVKRFQQDNDRIILMPENPAYEPNVVTDVNILGKVIGLIRRF